VKTSKRSARRGFTLAEIAVTIVIVGVGLVLVLQGLNTAKITAAQTRNTRLARELALYTLGQVEAGLYQDDIEQGLNGNYSEMGYTAFSYEVIAGDATFRERDPNSPYDSWQPTQKELDDKKKDGDEITQPFEKVKVRVTFPKFGEYSNELILERWIPWEQVYGTQDESTTSGSKSSSGGSSSSGSSSGASSSNKSSGSSTR